MSLEIFGVEGLPEIKAGDDLAGLIAEAAELADGDVVVVTQKIVSKAEDAMVAVDPDDPMSHKPVVEQESVRVLRRSAATSSSARRSMASCVRQRGGRPVERGLLMQAALLPDDPDRSARRIRDGIRARGGLDVGVIVSDTFGRPWRRGVADVAIGVAGVRPILDLRGTPDATGRELQVTEVAIVDELAAAAELVMGKTENVPVAVIRGIDPSWLGPGSIQADLIRPPGEDLFR